MEFLETFLFHLIISIARLNWSGHQCLETFLKTELSPLILVRSVNVKLKIKKKMNIKKKKKKQKPILIAALDLTAGMKIDRRSCRLSTRYKRKNKKQIIRNVILLSRINPVTAMQMGYVIYVIRVKLREKNILIDTWFV